MHHAYHKRKEPLDLWSLEERRNRVDLLEAFRMYKRCSVITFDTTFKLDSNTRTRGHSAKITKCRCRIDLRQHFFSARVVNRWNSLQQNDLDCAMIVAFKKRLQRTRSTSIGFFTDSGPTSRWATSVFKFRNQVRPHLVCTW